MRLHTRWFVPFLLFAACGSHHPLDGAWGQKLPDGAKGITLEFETTGTRVQVHGAPRADGGHDHIEGVTYSWDATAKTITVKGPLLGPAKADTWTGSVSGEQMELGSADGKLQFQRGAEVHGH
ncbi:MAG: hypothetical protein JNM25_11750 [Planctomycetes bacterium]|nr:hypothetical protein [Planctomycetota bacterium]